MESQPRPKNLFDDLRENYILILGAGFSDWLLWFLRLRIEKRLSESRDWYEYLADDRISENSNQVFLRHFSKQTKRYDGGAVKFVDELWRRWTKHRPALLESAPAPLAPEPPRGAIFISYAGEDIEAAKRLKAGLDSAGLEVWFDKAELQGGDTFALKITSNIKRCSLFLQAASACLLEKPPPGLCGDDAVAAIRRENRAFRTKDCQQNWQRSSACCALTLSLRAATSGKLACHFTVIPIFW
jgi:hypothetical protein